MLISTNAMAALLAPGTTIPPSPTASPTGATQLGDTGAVAFTSADLTSFSGSLRTRVYNNDPGNPFGATGLTFTYLLTNNGPDALQRLVTINFTGLSTDVGVNPASVAGAPPTSIDRSVDGKTIGWDYTTSPGVTPGGNSVLLVAHTNALQFQNVTNSVINGSFATVASLGPAVPEPATIGLAGVAFLGLVARRRSN